MIARPDYIRRKFVCVGTAIALGVFAAIILGEGTQAPAELRSVGAGAREAHLEAIRDTENYDPWRPYASRRLADDALSRKRR